MGEQTNAPERVEVNVRDGRAVGIVHPFATMPGAAPVVDYVRADLYEQAIRERDEWKGRKDQAVSARSQAHHGWAKAEAGRDRLREALERLEDKAHRNSTYGRALTAAEVRSDCAAALSGVSGVPCPICAAPNTPDTPDCRACHGAGTVASEAHALILRIILADPWPGDGTTKFSTPDRDQVRDDAYRFVGLSVPSGGDGDA